MSARVFLLCGTLLFAPAALAQQAQPYAGQQARDIKALSPDEVKQYLAGAGMGYAKAAELNRYPGPMHVLELSDKLRLTADQRERTAALMQSHKAEARALGGKLIDSEQALDALFKLGKVDGGELASRVRAVAAAQGEYRLSHLDTHRRMRALLNAEQVAQYDFLRGYGGKSEAPRHGGGTH